jgi:hypothetical protein
MLLGVRAVVANPADKRALFLSTGAIAVDMESHVVARTAAAHGLPMAAIRVITDPAKRAIPSTALAAMRPDGTIDVLAVLRSLMKKPRDLGGLMRSALDARAACATLRHGRKLLGPGLGLPEFQHVDLALGERPAANGGWRGMGAALGIRSYRPAIGALQNAE